MLNKIIGFSIGNKLIIGLFTIALIGYGAYEVTKLPIDAVPDITNNQVQVITVAPSYGATDIERLVTFPIEQVNNSIAGLKEIRSFSRFGLSLVTIVFDDATDIYWARQQVSERLQKVRSQIPPEIGVPELGPITTGLGEIYQYVVRAKPGYEKKYDETSLRTIQDWIIRRQLLGVEGIAEVSSFGGKLKQFEIAVDPNKLQSYNVTISDVFNALEKNNQNTGGAYIEKGSAVLFIRSEGLIRSEEEIGKICVKTTTNGTPIFVKNIANVKTGYATRYGAMCYNDKGEVAGAIVMMMKGANSNKVIENVRKRIAQIQKTLPAGVIIEPFLDRTKMVNQAIGTVEKNLLEGALIVVFILVLFLGNVRAGLLVASVIPLAMLFAIILMNMFGVSGNLMSLGALDFGLIVDGAVIIVEAVMHQLAQSKQFKNVYQLDQSQMDREVKQSAAKMMNSAVFGQIIILVVYLPIFTLQGIEGKMFKPMAQTVAFALLGAFILSLTYIPMMSALFLSKKTKHRPNLSDKLINRIDGLYQLLLLKALRVPKRILTVVVVLFVGAIITLTSLGGEFIPALEEGDFAVETRMLTGSSLNTTIDNTQKAAHILKTRFPEVEKVVTKIGSGEVPTDPMPMEASDIMVILKDKKDWVSATTFDDLAAKMTLALREIPGITASFQFPVQMRFNELMTGARQDVVCKLFGENLDTLSTYAQKIGAIVNTVKGTKNLYVESVTGMPQVIIEYNRNALAQYNLTVAEINKIVNTAFAGQSAGFIYDGEKRFDMVVRLDIDRRKDLMDIQNLLIPTPLGSQIPLYQLADVAIKNGPNQIQREDAKRRIVIGFNVGGRDVESIVNELRENTDQQIKFPTGYYVTYGGAFENLNTAKQRLMIAVPVSLILIFILLFFAFGSIKHGLLIYSAIPLSAIGGIFFLALRGMPFSISAGVGFIALFGVAVLNGIVLIAEFNRLKQGNMTNMCRVIVRGTKSRLRPILMTACVASLGFLPMALSNGAGAEVQRPLATVVIGGLMIATFLTLFVLPILYLLFEKGLRPKPTAGMLVLLISCFSISANGQVKIQLQAAIDSAIKNNLSIRNEVLTAEYEKKKTKTYTSVPQANIMAEYGQINSIYKDNRIGISQSFNFPSVYGHQKKMLDEAWKTALLNRSLKEAEIKKMVRQLFYTLLYLQEKEKLLLQNDTIYSGFLLKANARFTQGESNILEKKTAETQRGNIAIQLSELHQDIELVQLQFKLLLNTKANLTPESPSLKITALADLDSSAVNRHPELKLIEQHKKIFLITEKLERSKLFPDLNIGYYSMTMRGNGADNITYGTVPRFNSIQVGIGVPLFFGAQNAKVKAAKIQQSIAENLYLSESLILQNQYKSLLVRYSTQRTTVSYFEITALPNATSILEIAKKQFTNGSINYMEWAMLTNQAISIQSGYLDAIKNLNETLIQIDYLLSK